MFAQGQVLNNTYRIVRLIGEGGMGVVYEADHARLAGRYAIKVLLRKLSDNPEALERFDREARITSSLQHPNIVQVIDFNTHTDGTEYLVMEYLQGETLAERLAHRGSLPMATVVDVVEQVAAGLAAAHSHGVVHRDLKPENIFLVPIEGRQSELAKVLDFGISKIADANRGLRGPESALMGTPQYMSPEQCRGRSGEVDAATDQFALAVIAYEMLTGRPPFCGDSVGTVLSQVLYTPPPPMGIDVEVDRVVRRGLAKSKHDRYASVTAFALALAAAVEAKPRAGDAIETAGSGDRQRPGANPWAAMPVFQGSTGEQPTIRETQGGPVKLRRPRRPKGPLILVTGAVGVTLLLAVGAAKVERGRRSGVESVGSSEPGPTAADLNRPPSPAAVAVSRPPRGEDSPHGGPVSDRQGRAPIAFSASTSPAPPRVAAPLEADAEVQPGMAEEDVAQPDRPTKPQDEVWHAREAGDGHRQIAHRDPPRPQRPPSLVEQRLTTADAPPELGRPAAASGGGQARPTSPALDDDAILPLNENAGESPSP